MIKPFKILSLFFSFILTLVLLNSCMGSIAKGYVKDMMRGSPAINWVYIHNNPKIGDYAIHKSKESGHAMRYEIVAYKNNLYEAKVNWVETTMGDSFLKDLEWHYYVAKNGLVKRAFFIDLSSGEKFNLKVPTAGEMGYVDPKPRKLKKADVFKTEIGTFESNEVAIYELIIPSWGGVIKMTNVNFVNPDVKFGMVNRLETAATDIPVVTVLDYLNTVNPYGTHGSIMNWVLGKAKGSSSKRLWEVVETN